MTIANPFSAIPREPGSPPVVTPTPPVVQFLKVPPPRGKAFSDLSGIEKRQAEFNRKLEKQIADDKAPKGTTWDVDQAVYVPIVEDTRPFIDKAIDVATALSQLPKKIAIDIGDMTQIASETVTLGLEKAGTNQDYSPPSLPKIRVELLGDAKKKFPGVVSVKRVHEQILVQGIRVLQQRMSKVQIELIEGVETSIKQFAQKTSVTLGTKIFAKAAAYATLKELIDTVAKTFKVASDVKTQAKIEAGIREESAASMSKFAKRAAYPQHRKFKDGATRVAKIVMSRQPKKSDVRS